MVGEIHRAPDSRSARRATHSEMAESRRAGGWETGTRRGGDAPGRKCFAAFGKRLSSLRVRPVGSSVAPQALASEAERGKSRASAAHARTHPRTRPMAASGGAWTLSILRSAHEPIGAGGFSVPSRLALASLVVAAEPERPRPLGSYAAPHHSLAAFAFCLSSLSLASHGRCHLRQEPDAGKPLVRIRGGGCEQS